MSSVPPEYRPEHLRKIPSQVLRCRAFGHYWSFSFAKASEEDSALFVGSPMMVGVCSTCGAMRLDFLNALGGLMQRRYVYPDGYQQRWEGDRPPRAAFIWSVMKEKGIT